jgi:hypothetical protein
MIQKLALTFFAGFLAFSAVFAGPALSPAYAQPTGTGGDQAQKGLDDIGAAFPEGAKRAKTIQEIVHLVINWALYLAAIVSVIFIIYGGFLYITAAGDTGQAGKGRTALVNALIGLAIVILSYLIVQIVYNFITKPI